MIFPFNWTEDGGLIRLARKMCVSSAQPPATPHYLIMLASFHNCCLEKSPEISLEPSVIALLSKLINWLHGGTAGNKCAWGVFQMAWWLFEEGLVLKMAEEEHSEEVKAALE